MLPFKFLNIAGGSRDRDPMRHLVMYSRVGRTKVIYAVSFTDLGQVLHQLIYYISPVTYLPRTPVTLFIFYYYS